MISTAARFADTVPHATACNQITVLEGGASSVLRERIHTLSANGFDAVVVAGRTGCVTGVNTEAVATVGLQVDRLQGRTVFSLFHAADLYPLFRCFAEMVSQGRVYASWRARFRTGQRWRWYEIAASNLLEECGVIALFLRGLSDG